MKLKHTPGPWKFNIKKDNGLYQLSGENGSQIGRLWSNKHAEANARLIAAAPEMLNVLIKLSKHADIIATPEQKEIFDIIEKATGLPIEEVIL